MIQERESNGKMAAKARDLIAAGRVRLTYDFDGKPDGGSVTNDEGHIYRVDFDFGGGRPHCQCRGFEYTGWCKHLTAIYMAASETKSKPEDEEPTDEELAAYAQQDEEAERVRQYILDAGLDGYYGIDGAAYALGW